MPLTPLMATRSGLSERTPEAEPVIVDTDTPNIVVLRLDDGETIEFDRRELLAATDQEAA